MGAACPRRTTVVAVRRRKRRGPVLTPSSLPCLSDIATINITEGCAHRCSYCYAQAYAGHPGRGCIVLSDNIPELVQAELERKRRRPSRVYFSPSSDAFQPIPEVLDVTYRTMSILLESGVALAFLTKGTVGKRFLALFSRRPAAVFAQIGITSSDEGYQKSFEPGASSPAQRLQTIENLMQIGVATQARLDPLIPDVTDTRENLEPLLAELHQRGIRSLAASYLFLRPTFARRFASLLRPQASSVHARTHWSWRRLGEGLGPAWTIDPEERRRRFDRLRMLAASYGIKVHTCACKNPDLADSSECQIAGPVQASSPHGRLPLFSQ